MGVYKIPVSKVCESQVACDGAYVVRRSKPDATVCSKCEKSLAARRRVILPRGINYQDKTDKKYKGRI